MDTKEKTASEPKMDKHEDFAAFLRKTQKRDSEREPGDLLGYRLEKFREIALRTDGIQPGFYIIGAPTNVGKTATQSNLVLDLVMSNKNARLYCYSLDDDKETYTYRFLAAHCQLPINKFKRKLEKPSEAKALADAYNLLYNLIEDRRLLIQDITDIGTVYDLETDMREAVKEGNLVVAIDGLHNLDMAGKFENHRTMNIERSTKLKAMVDEFRIPIICTAELRKYDSNGKSKRMPELEDLMETGKLAYDANVVWLLSCEVDNDTKKIDDSKLLLKFAKNKLSEFKGTIPLEFDKWKSHLKEKDTLPF